MGVGRDTHLLPLPSHLSSQERRRRGQKPVPELKGREHLPGLRLGGIRTMG